MIEISTPGLTRVSPGFVSGAALTLECFPFQEIRSDMSLFLDRIIIAKRCQRPAFTVRICPSVSNELREPDRVTAAVGVLDDMRHHAKPVPIEQ
jgi:hypothetical protein